MSHSTHPNPSLLNPDRWNGYNIFDEDTFINASHEPGLRLSRHELSQAGTYLSQNLGQVILGNHTEIRFGLGK